MNIASNFKENIPIIIAHIVSKFVSMFRLGIEAKPSDGDHHRRIWTVVD